MAASARSASAMLAWVGPGTTPTCAFMILLQSRTILRHAVSLKGGAIGGRRIVGGGAMRDQAVERQRAAPRQMCRMRHIGRLPLCGHQHARLAHEGGWKGKAERGTIESGEHHRPAGVPVRAISVSRSAESPLASMIVR